MPVHTYMRILIHHSIRRDLLIRGYHYPHFWNYWPPYYVPIEMGQIMAVLGIWGPRV